MFKSKLAIFIDSTISAIIILLLTYPWINKIIKNAFLSLFIANISSLFVFVMVFLHFLKQQKINKSSHKEQNLFNNSLNFLLYSSSEYQLNYFCDLLNLTFIDKNLYQNNQYCFYINITNQLTSNDFYYIHNYNLSNKLNKQLIIISLSVDEGFLDLLNNSPIKYPLFLKEDLFEIMKINNGFIIKETTNNTPIFTKIKNRFKSLSKVKFKNLFSSGASLVLLSFFIPYNYLYLTIGSLLLTFSIISLLSKNKLQTPETKISIKDLTKK